MSSHAWVANTILEGLSEDQAADSSAAVTDGDTYPAIAPDSIVLPGLGLRLLLLTVFCSHCGGAYADVHDTDCPVLPESTPPGPPSPDEPPPTPPDEPPPLDPPPDEPPPEGGA